MVKAWRWPLWTALSLTIHRITACKETTTLLNRCGVGIRYSRLYTKKIPPQSRHQNQSSSRSAWLWIIQNTEKESTSSICSRLHWWLYRHAVPRRYTETEYWLGSGWYCWWRLPVRILSWGSKRWVLGLLALLNASWSISLSFGSTATDCNI